jgi:hypothetical protein
MQPFSFLSWLPQLRTFQAYCGSRIAKKPNSHIRPDDIKDAPPESPRYNIHADLLLLRHDMKLYIDVCVTRPTSTSNLAAHPHVQRTWLYSTRGPVKEKHKKYDAIAEANEYRMFAFAMESSDGLASESTELLRNLAAHSQEYTPQKFLLHAHRRLSVVLQSSNANIALRGMQHLHLQQHHGSPERYAQYQRNRNVAQARPLDSDMLERRMHSTVLAAAASAAGSEAGDIIGDETLSFVHDGRLAFADVDSTVEFAEAA